MISELEKSLFFAKDDTKQLAAIARSEARKADQWMQMLFQVLKVVEKPVFIQSYATMKTFPNMIIMSIDDAGNVILSAGNGSE